MAINQVTTNHYRNNKLVKYKISVNLSVNSSVYCSSQDVRYSCVNFIQNVSLNDSVNTLFNDNSQSDLSSQDTIQYSESDSSSSSQDTIQYSEIKILSINVGGLRNKPNTPEWEETILKYDVVYVQETHFDAYDSLDLQGFKCLSLMTRNNAKVKSGGGGSHLGEGLLV